MERTVLALYTFFRPVAFVIVTSTSSPLFPSLLLHLPEPAIQPSATFVAEIHRPSSAIIAHVEPVIGLGRLQRPFHQPTLLFKPPALFRFFAALQARINLGVVQQLETTLSLGPT